MNSPGINEKLTAELKNKKNSNDWEHYKTIKTKCQYNRKKAHNAAMLRLPE